MKTRKCESCGKTKPLATGFYRVRGCKGGHQSKCKSCQSKINSATNQRRWAKYGRTERAKAWDVTPAEVENTKRQIREEKMMAVRIA